MTVLPRLILLHQQATSGRVGFLCLRSGVVAFAPRPERSALRDDVDRNRLRRAFEHAPA